MEHNDDRDPSTIWAAILPLVVLAVIAGMSVADRSSPGRYVLAVGAGLIGLVSPFLIARRAHLALAGLCVFVLAASLCAFNVLGIAEQDRQISRKSRRPMPTTVTPTKNGTASSPKAAAPNTAPDKAEQLLALGLELFEKGEIERAKSAYRSGLEEAQAKSRTGIALTLSVGLAEAYLKQGDATSALKAVEDGLAMSRRSTASRKGVPPEDVIRLLVVEGLARAAMKDAEAIPTMERALALSDEHHGENVALREAVLKKLLDLLGAARRKNEIVGLIDTHLERIGKVEPRDPSAMADWHEAAGRLLGSMGKAEESVTRFEQAVALRDGDAEADPLKAAFVRVNLAVSLSKLEQKKRASQVLAAAQKVLSEKLPPEHDARRTADALRVELEALAPK